MLYFSRFLFVGSLLSVAVGCSGQPVNSPADTPANNSGTPAASVDDHAHDHPTEGPHHGSLVELGSHQYHIEVTHDASSVTLYVLDGQANQNAPIDTNEVLINLMQAGTPKQFKLPANPQASDPSGKSSRFTLADADLVSLLDDHDAAPSVSLTIDGTPYSGKIEHEHAHDHDHN